MTTIESANTAPTATELADDLYAARDWDIGEYSRDRELGERIWRKYPGW